MPPTRQQICSTAADALTHAAALPSVLLGFDGFVDSIIEVVHTRHAADRYDRIQNIADFGQKVLAAAGQSCNYEFVITRQKLGGNGPIMANALAALGFGVTCVGPLGLPAIHPAFAELAARANLISLAEPAYTDALEFLDGKLMFGKHGALANVTWPTLLARVGPAPLGALFQNARLIGLLNWTMIPHMTDIWNHLLTEVFPILQKDPAHPRPRIFIDLADPEKRTTADLRLALDTLARFQPFAAVTLGLNLKESQQVAAALSLTPPAAPATTTAKGTTNTSDATSPPNTPFDSPAESALPATARAIREMLQLDTVVIHPRQGAAAATARESLYFPGPFCANPKISTGAGDHFNAGFAASQLLQLPLPESLALATAISGYYVRHAQSPTAEQLAAFLRSM